MFFFVFTSHSEGTFFMFETWLRSGVPPHIGQSGVPGSEAASRTGALAATTREQDEQHGEALGRLEYMLISVTPSYWFLLSEKLSR